MTQPTTSETPVAEKRAWLQANGHQVGTRGKLSAEHEQAFAARTPAQPQLPTA